MKKKCDFVHLNIIIYLYNFIQLYLEIICYGKIYEMYTFFYKF